MREAVMERVMERVRDGANIFVLVNITHYLRSWKQPAKAT